MQNIDTKTQKNIIDITNGSIDSPLGFKGGGQKIGLSKNKPDIGWIYSKAPAISAGVYTTNLFQAAPLKVTKDSLKNNSHLQAVIVNTTCANSCTGLQGIKNAYKTRNLTANHFRIPKDYVAVASTGLIGTQLNMAKIKKGIQTIKLKKAPYKFENSILTTDKHSKHLAVQMKVDGKKITIGGSCKGSGMIHPNMATMLGFITTDASIEQACLKKAFKEIIDESFNCITVDGDTSTNDMVLVMANGLGKNHKLNKSHPQWKIFLKGLKIVCQFLAQNIAKGGEGATKLLETQVSGARNTSSAKIISKTIIGSNLVKTALFGEDINWGRVICALGYSGEKFDINHVTMSLGNGQKIFANGIAKNFDTKKASQYLRNKKIILKIVLKEGRGKAIAWGCDLTYKYVKINSSYSS